MKKEAKRQQVSDLLSAHIRAKRGSSGARRSLITFGLGTSCLHQVQASIHWASILGAFWRASLGPPLTHPVTL